MYKKALKLKSVTRASVIAAGLIATQAHAVGNGMYMGIMFGPATNTGGTLNAQQALWCQTPACTVPTYQVPTTPPPAINYPTLKTPVDPKSSQFGSRIYIGNQFNRYAALELGFNYFTSISYDSHNVPTITSTKITIRNGDLQIVGIMPFGSLFSVSAKAGIAVIYETSSGDLNSPTHNLKTCKGISQSVFLAQKNNPGSASNSCGPLVGSGITPPNQYYKNNYVVYGPGQNTYNVLYRPVISLDAAYALNQSWVVDLQVMQIMTGSSPGNVRYAGLGLTYHFSDKYCGQFLCDGY